MMLFWILAITDLIMVGITWAVYGSSATYRDGMLLGVHLPESAISLSPVAQLTDSYQKHIRKFYLLHLVLGVVVAIPFFWLASIGITLWCIWLCVFLIRAVSLLYSAHRQLYLLKQDLKLCNPAEEPFTAAVDTHTATQTGKTALSLYWHLLPLAMVFIPLFFSPVRNYIHSDTTGLLFLVIWIAVWLLFLLISWCYSKTGNRIYSAHSEINLAINMQEHRSWSRMFFFYNLCNSLAFISELIFLANDLEWYWWSHLLFFIFQTIPIVTIFVIYFRVKKKKAQILAADDAPIYVDDDYYWRNGWYNNPVDPRVNGPRLFLRDELYYQYGKTRRKDSHRRSGSCGCRTANLDVRTVLTYGFCSGADVHRWYTGFYHLRLHRHFFLYRRDPGSAASGQPAGRFLRPLQRIR